MISYELAKKLKEAGFPFDWDFIDISSYDHQLPSLSELIEACESLILPLNGWQKPYQTYLEIGMNLHHFGSQKNIGTISEWRASIIQGIDDTWEGQQNYFGKTPEEAVAHLWINLNQKDSE